jgi:predicted esterase
MMRRLLLLSLLGLCFFRGTPAAAQAERFEVGQRLRALETAWEAYKDPEARARALKTLRGVVAQFLQGRHTEGARILTEAVNALRSAAEPSAEVRWAQSLSVRLRRRVADTRLAELPVVLEPFYSVKTEMPRGTVLKLTLLAGDGRTVLAAHETPVGKLPLETALPLKTAGPRAGDHLLRAEIVAGGKVLTAAPDQTVSLASDLSARLTSLIKGIKGLPAQPPDTDTLTLRQLAGVLSALAVGQSLETNYPAARLLAEAEATLQTVQAGKPYFGEGKTGEFWLRLATGKTPTAVRLLAPDAIKAGKPLPLVIALHGAGGSENLFFDGYGHGEVVRLCRERGWLLVAPRTEGFAFVAPVAAVVDAVHRLYPVDRKRVFLVGHSMGAMQAVKAVQEAPEAIAGVAALGGGGSIKDSEALKAVPFFIGVGSRDFLLSSARVLKDSLGKAGVRTVEYHEYPEVEHLMVVQIALPEVFAFFDKVAKR